MTSMTGVDDRPGAGQFPWLLADERGAEQMEYLLIFAAVGLPMIVAARLMWAVLLFYFAVESLFIDLPFF